jgi:hypothetical protein
MGGIDVVRLHAELLHCLVAGLPPCLVARLVPCLISGKEVHEQWEITIAKVTA